MDRSEFYRYLDELLELPRGTITGEATMKDLEAWDSVAVISFIAMVDTNYGLTVPTNGIVACVTAADLAALVEQQRSKAAPAR